MADGTTTDQMNDDLQNDMGELDFATFEEATSDELDDTIEDKSVKEPTDEVDLDDPDLQDDNNTEDDKVDDKEEENPEDVKDEKKSEEDNKTEETKPSKKILAQNGEESVELDPNTKFKHMVDGKEQEITLQEMLNREAGERTIAQRMGDLSTEKQNFKVEQSNFNAEKEELVGKVNSFVEAVNNQDGLQAIESLANLTGHNSIELRQHFKDLVVKDVKAYLEMTPEEQREFDIKQETAYYKQLSEVQNQNVEQQQTSMDLQNSILRFQAKHGIKDADLVALYDEAEAKSFEMQSAEDLERFYNEKLTQDRSSKLLSDVDPSLSEDTTNLETVKEFITKNPDLSDEEVVQAIKEVIGEVEDTTETKPKIKENSTSDKIKKKQAKNSKAKKITEQEFEVDDDEDELLTFDDLDY